MSVVSDVKGAHDADQLDGIAHNTAAQQTACQTKIVFMAIPQAYYMRYEQRPNRRTHNIHCANVPQEYS